MGVLLGLFTLPFGILICCGMIIETLMASQIQIFFVTFYFISADNSLFSQFPLLKAALLQHMFHPTGGGSIFWWESDINKYTVYIP